MAQERLIRQAEVARLVGLGATTVWELERKGLFPRRRLIVPGGRLIGWVSSEVEEWIRSREVGAPPAPRAALLARGVAPPEAA